MENQKITKASILKSKVELMADRNERFAMVEMELEDLKEELSDKLTTLSKKINDVLHAK